MARNRLFIAAPFSDGLKRAIQNAQEEVRDRFPGFRFGDPRNMHLTLRFLGELDDDGMNQACRLTRRVVQELAPQPFSLHLTGLGAFPSPEKARVIWMGVQGDVEVARQLADALDRAAQLELGVPREAKAWTPHVTIARLASGRGGHAKPVDVRAALDHYARLDVGRVTIDDIVTYRSHLNRRGPDHEDLLHAPLS